jgi:hypothetical protein
MLCYRCISSLPVSARLSQLTQPSCNSASHPAPPSVTPPTQLRIINLIAHLKCMILSNNTDLEKIHNTDAARPTTKAISCPFSSLLWRWGARIISLRRRSRRSCPQYIARDTPCVPRSHLIIICSDVVITVDSPSSEAERSDRIRPLIRCRAWSSGPGYNLRIGLPNLDVLVVVRKNLVSLSDFDTQRRDVSTNDK